MILVALLFAISDVVWQALIAGIVAIVLAYMQQRTKNAVVSIGEKAAATLKDSTTSTDNKLNEHTEALKEIHVAVNSTLTTAVEKEAAALYVAYLALKRIYEMQPPGPQKEEDRVVMEAAKMAWEKSAGLVRDKADSLKIEMDKKAEQGDKS